MSLENALCPKFCFCYFALQDMEKKCQIYGTELLKVGVEDRI